MPRKPIGVWFSLALVIAVLSGLIGYPLGRKFALSRYRARQESRGSLPRDERERLMGMLPQLAAIGTASTSTYLQLRARQQGTNSLVELANWLAQVREHTQYEDVRQIAALDLAVAYINLAIAEERDNRRDLKQKYLAFAQQLLQGLGWTDVSEPTLRAVAQKELEHWSLSDVRTQPK